MSKYNYPKIVVTGLGAITPIGNNVEETWNSLISGKSGAGPITHFDTTYFDTKFACEVKGFDPLQYFNRKESTKNGFYLLNMPLQHLQWLLRIQD
jgi:3-oxoacyl-[acyl-carrier-protein] synthase II